MIKFFMILIIFFMTGCVRLQINLGSPVNNFYVIKPQIVGEDAEASMIGSRVEDIKQDQDGSIKAMPIP
tara:strand:- start:3984 stop:4190 length:207 start_codon:yes stop_codon:yes gene_type:complete